MTGTIHNLAFPSFFNKRQVVREGRARYLGVSNFDLLGPKAGAQRSCDFEGYLYQVGGLEHFLFSTWFENLPEVVRRKPILERFVHLV